MEWAIQQWAYSKIKPTSLPECQPALVWRPNQITRVFTVNSHMQLTYWAKNASKATRMLFMTFRSHFIHDIFEIWMHVWMDGTIVAKVDNYSPVALNGDTYQETVQFCTGRYWLAKVNVQSVNSTEVPWERWGIGGQSKNPWHQHVISHQSSRSRVNVRFLNTPEGSVGTVIWKGWITS